MRKYPKPKLGEVIENWTVIDDVPQKYKKFRTKCYKVKCTCGNVSMVPAYALYSGQSTKCGSCGSKSGSSERHLGNNEIIGKYLSNCKHRAKKKGMSFDLTPEYLEYLFKKQQRCCALTKIPLQLRINSSNFEFTASLDRIDSSKGYVEGNVQWVHKWINKMKLNLPQEKFFELCRAVISNNQLLGTRILSRLKVEGIHRWANCPIDEVSFLKNYHRHMFHITCSKFVCHNDRDIEFIQFSHTVQTYLNQKYYSEKFRCLFFDNLSCEMLAEELYHKFDLFGCEVNEDGEGGSIIGML